MNYKILGKTKSKVSEVGFGALQFSRIEQKKAINLVREAYNFGINIIDTGHNYPHSEEILGKALKGIRNNIILSSKSMSRKKKEFLKQFELSLKRLKTDYIDIYMFHDTSKNEQFEKLVSGGVIDALIKEKKKGRVRFIGFSCHNPSVMEKYYKINDFEVVMIPFNFISNEFTEYSIYEKAINNNIGILGMKPFGGGRIRDIKLCFKYLRKFDRIIPIMGIESMKELCENIKYIESKESITYEDEENILKIKKELGSKFCRGCSYCLPCPKGINIPEVNFIKLSYKHFPEEEFFFTDEVKKIMEKSLDCVDCGECEKKCPFNLEIRKMLKENYKFYLDKIKEKF